LNPKIRKKRDVGRRVRSSCKRGLEIIFQISFFFQFLLKKQTHRLWIYLSSSTTPIFTCLDKLRQLDL
jgi:hypothetical protein